MNLDGGELQFQATDGYDFINPINIGMNGGSLDTNGMTVTFNATITGDLGSTFTKKGEGTLILARGQGAYCNQYVEAGTLRNSGRRPRNPTSPWLPSPRAPRSTILMETAKISAD